jgi:predicted ATPase/class 3 adenylate cyclase
MLHTRRTLLPRWDGRRAPGCAETVAGGAVKPKRETPTVATRPTGTVTFLFSDIEGSTERWERDRELMASAIARHDALVRAAFETHQAYVFKTMGDAFCAAFARPEDAIAAALEAQRAIAAEDFSAVGGVHVRMALHTGSATERDGDYFGPAVNRVARILTIGHGGQVLVSGTSADLLQGVMPPQASLRDLGAHRLKDLARPEQVYQLVALDLPQMFPALRSLDQLPNNLPPQLTSFVGREDELTEIKTLLEQHRFVTLVGTGGAGKTRCAIQVGADLLDGSGDGVWLVELAPISDPSLIGSLIAKALNVQGEPNRPPLDAVLTFLKRKRLLLIVDNCEHVIDEARNVVGAVLRNCADVRVLATSREGLNVGGERVHRMPSLPIPSKDESLTPTSALQYGAIALFADRALAADDRFSLSDENTPHVAEICRRLDGIPLAIELAAARVKVLSPKQLAQKLDERFRVLTGGDRSALPRQQTMRALVDWSYDLLSDDERTLFRKLSIFAGGFTLESASTICSDGAIDEIAILDMLSSLVDKSLVHAEPAANGTRYRLLESMRQYARERLTERGEYPAVAQAHASAFLTNAQELDRLFETTPNRAWIMQAEPELENWRAALEWALTGRNDVALARRLAGLLQWMWYFFAPAEGRRWVGSAIETIDDTTPEEVVARLDLAIAHIDGALTQRKASYEAAERARSRFRKLGDARGEAEAQRIAGGALALLGRASEGEAILYEALAQAQRLGERKMVGRILGGIGMAQTFAGNIPGARTSYAEALAMARVAGDEHAISLLAANLAETEFKGGDAEAALQRAGETIETLRAPNFARRIAITLANMAQYLVALDRYDEARERAREAVAVSRDAQADVWTVFALQHLAAIGALAPAEPITRARSARLMGYVDARIDELDAVRETEELEYQRVMPALREALGNDSLEALMREGGTWNEDQAVAEAMLI